MKAAFTLIYVVCVLSFTVANAAPSVTVVGNQTDPFAKITPNRDGGSVGIIGGKIVWLYSDTDYNKDGTFYGFYVNTGAVGQAGNPLAVVGPAKQVIPFTATEDAYNKKYNYSPRYNVNRIVENYH